MALSPNPISNVVERPASGRFEMAFNGGVVFAAFRQQGNELIVPRFRPPMAV